MSMDTPLTRITATRIGDHILIPHGLTPAYALEENGQWIAFVEGWTGAKELDTPYYDLYLWIAANRQTIPVRPNDDGETDEREWYTLQGTRRTALKMDGKFTERVCLRTLDEAESFCAVELPLPESLEDGRFLTTEQTTMRVESWTSREHVPLNSQTSYFRMVPLLDKDRRRV
jgi:hypothetical protein